MLHANCKNEHGSPSSLTYFAAFTTYQRVARVIPNWCFGPLGLSRGVDDHISTKSTDFGQARNRCQFQGIHPFTQGESQPTTAPVPIDFDHWIRHINHSPVAKQKTRCNWCNECLGWSFFSAGKTLAERLRPKGHILWNVGHDRSPDSYLVSMISALATRAWRNQWIGLLCSYAEFMFTAGDGIALVAACLGSLS